MKDNQFTALLYGWTVIFGLILAASFILGILLRFTTMQETTFTWLTLAVGFIIFFIGGLIAGIKGKQKGWIIGAVTGLSFTLFIFLVQYFGFQTTFSSEQSLQHAGFIVAALVGGMIGVNMVVGQKE